MGRISQFLLLCRQLLNREGMTRKDAEIPERQSASSPSFFAMGLFLGSTLGGNKRAPDLSEREWPTWVTSGSREGTDVWLEEIRHFSGSVSHLGPSLKAQRSHKSKACSGHSRAFLLTQGTFGAL